MPDIKIIYPKVMSMCIIHVDIEKEILGDIWAN